jgi:hypothetical protein
MGAARDDFRRVPAPLSVAEEPVVEEGEGDDLFWSTDKALGTLTAQTEQVDPTTAQPDQALM